MACICWEVNKMYWFLSATFKRNVLPFLLYGTANNNKHAIYFRHAGSSLQEAGNFGVWLKLKVVPPPSMIISEFCTLCCQYFQLASAEVFMQESQLLMYGNGKDRSPTALMFDKQHVKGLYFNQSPSKVKSVISFHEILTLEFRQQLWKWSWSPRSFLWCRILL